MKKLPLIILVVSIHNILYCQSSVSLGLDIGLASNFANSSKAGFGGSAEYANKFSKNIGARIYVGYHYFKGKFSRPRGVFIAQVLSIARPREF